MIGLVFAMKTLKAGGCELKTQFASGWALKKAVWTLLSHPYDNQWVKGRTSSTGTPKAASSLCSVGAAQAGAAAADEAQRRRPVARVVLLCPRQQDLVHGWHLQMNSPVHDGPLSLGLETTVSLGGMTPRSSPAPAQMYTREHNALLARPHQRLCGHAECSTSPFLTHAKDSSQLYRHASSAVDMKRVVWSSLVRPRTAVKKVAPCSVASRQNVRAEKRPSTGRITAETAASGASKPALGKTWIGKTSEQHESHLSPLMCCRISTT